jgi:hypothetical protein
MKKYLLVISILLLACGNGLCQDVLDLLPDQPGALTCWTEIRTLPRPIRIHYLKVSLTAPAIELFAIPGEDPDGSGPAESQLTKPGQLFAKSHAIAAVNANAFQGVSGDSAAAADWYEGRPVDIHGITVSGRKVVSPIETGRTSFWIDVAGKPHIGTPASMDSVAEAVADWFSPLLIDSKIVADSSDKALHPRTALGFCRVGNKLQCGESNV